MRSPSSILAAALVVLAAVACGAPDRPAAPKETTASPPVETVETVAAGCPTAGAPHAPLPDESGRAIRYGPIVTGGMLPPGSRRNISGPAPIEMPDWLPSRLGRYYLYFSSHRPPYYIRLAYSDQITGPWQVAGPAAVAINHPAPAATAILAPDAVVDHERREVRLYVSMHFRAGDSLGRRAGTYGTVSNDGRSFTVRGGRLGAPYGRALRRDDATYLFLGASGQRVIRSVDGFSAPSTGPAVLPRYRDPKTPYARHVALQQVGDALRVFYTRKLESPERVLMGTIDLGDDWRRWRVAGEEEVLRPALPYEGAGLPLTRSRPGPAARTGEHALRDPAILTAEGRTWLFYTIAGECGIGLAELRF